jgi:DNA-binding transcriptional ArsR family regulator
MAATSRKSAEKTAELFSLVADPTRILILQALSMRGGANVQAICEYADASQSAVSHQLQLLVEASVARARKEGRVVTYTIAPTATGRKISRLLRFK